MATSIAKLAILLTADASGLRPGFTAGERFVASFGRVTGGAIGSLGGLMNHTTADAVGMAKSLNSANGQLNNLLGLAAGRGPLIALAAAFVYLGKRSLDSAEEAVQAQVKMTNAYEEAWAAATGQRVDFGDNKINTLTGQWEKLKATLSSSAGVVTGPLLGAFTELLRVANMFATRANDFWGVKESDAKKRMALQQDFIDKQKAAAAAQEKADQEASARFSRMAERMKSQADSLTKSLRTPAEVFADSMREITDLATRGLISAEVMNRATAKAREDLEKTFAVAEKVKAITATPGVAAVDRNTSAGFSAVQAGKAQLQAMAETEKQALAEAKKQTEVQKRIDETLRAQKPPLAIGKVSI